MRIPFLSLALLLFASGASAQLRVGVKWGIDISSVRFDSELLKSGNMLGFHFGPLLELMTPLGLGADVALLYSRKGMNAEGKKLKTAYLEVPLNLKYTISLPATDDLFKVWLAAGPYVAFRLSDKVFDEPRFRGLLSKVETKAFAAGLNLGIGIEVLTHLQLGFIYGLGLTDNYSGKRDYTFDEIASSSLVYDRNGIDISGKSRNMSITAVFLF